MEVRRSVVLKVDQVIWSTSQFIGRQDELDFLYRHYRGAKEKRSSVALLIGEPGIGKTRLLDEFAHRTMRDGALVLRGSAFEAEGMPPYLPFLEALGRYIRTTPWDLLQKQIAHAPSTLLSIFPELAVHLDNTPLSSSLAPEQARLRLYEAIGRFLESISHFQVLVLILDDLHWVDSASLDLLCYITRYHPHTNILIVGAYRAGEVSRNQALDRALAELVRQRMLATLSVEPLSHSEIEALAVSTLGGPISSDVGLLLYIQCEGNPFFAEELVRGWVETKVLIQGENGWYAPELLACTLPPSITGALRRRFALLEPDIVGSLRIAAIIGRTFDLALLATVENREIESIEERLVEAEQAQLVHPEQEGMYTFTHNIIRASLYTEVSPSRRRRLHEAIGHVLEESYAKNGAKSAYDLAAIAFHFTQSGNGEHAVAYNQQAEGQALQILAAEEKNQSRIDFIKRGEQQNAYPWLALLLSLQGSWREAEQAVVRAHPISHPESLSFLWHIHGFLAFQRQDYAVAERHFRAARANHQNGPIDALLATSLLGVTLVAIEKLPEAAAILNELEGQLNELTSSGELLAPVMICMALTAVAVGDQQRMERFYTALLAFQGQHHLFLVDRVLGEICIARGEWKRAMPHLNEAEATAKHRGLRPELARILLSKARCEGAQATSESRARAVSILLSALSIYDELHMVEAAGRVLAWLNTLAPDTHSRLYVSPTNRPYTHRVNAPHPQASAANLTKSETRVVQLVAGGKSNRQIAQELGISEKTVANHLSHIFSKTTSENRAAAAAFAIRHGFA